MFNEEISKIIEENDIADLLIDVCATLYHNGITYVHVGGLMRILGISDEKAIDHDNTYFELDDDFAESLAKLEAIDQAFDQETSEEELLDADIPPTIH